MSKSESIPIKNTLAAFLDSTLPQRSSLIVGVSGGADSMALLHALHSLQEKVFVVHVNYGLRGKDSELDQELVEGLAFEWGMECCSVQLKSREAEGQNFQQWAREQRYNIFKGLMDAEGASAILVAHHQDDQVETILQKVFRGSGPEAWQGMSAFDGTIARPLLGYTKEEILQYCKGHAIPFREDSSNQKSAYARNLIRNELAERMDALLPGWKKNVLKLEDWGALMDESLASIESKYESNTTFPLQIFELETEVVSKALLKRFLAQHKVDVSAGQLQEIQSLHSAQVGSSVVYNPSIKVVREREGLTVVEFDDASDSMSFQIERPTSEESTTIEVENFLFNYSTSKCSEFYLSADSLMWPLEVRNWQSGDRLQPLGMQGTQTVADHLTNRKIPNALRDKSLVLCGTDGTIYAIIYPEPTKNGLGMISELVKVDGDTKQYLSIRLKEKL